MAITPIIVWKLPSHFANCTKYFPKAGMLERIPIDSNDDGNDADNSLKAA